MAAPYITLSPICQYQNSNVPLLGTLFSHLPKLRRSSFGILFSITSSLSCQYQNSDVSLLGTISHTYQNSNVPLLVYFFPRCNKTSRVHSVSCKTRNCLSVAMNPPLPPGFQQTKRKTRVLRAFEGNAVGGAAPYITLSPICQYQNSNVPLLVYFFHTYQNSDVPLLVYFFSRIQQNQPRPQRFLQNPQLSERSDEQPHPPGLQQTKRKTRVLRAFEGNHLLGTISQNNTSTVFAYLKVILF